MIRRIATAVFCGTLLASTALAQTLSDDKVRIGVLTDMSGPYRDTGGPGSVEAARMAVADFGGTIFGKPIEVVVGDHQNKPDVGVSLARRWYDVDGVDAIFDINNSAISLAINTLVESNGKVVINTGAASVALTNEGCTSNAVHYTYDTYALAKGAVEGLAQIGGKQNNWYVVGVDYTFGKQMTEMFTGFLRQKGNSIVGTAFHPLNASDVSSFMLMAQQSKADNIALTNAGADLVNAVKAAREFGIVPKQRIVPTLMLINNVHALGLPTSQGLVFTEGFYWNRTPQARTWSQRFFSKIKQMPSMVHAGTYSAVTQYLKAIQASGTDDGKAVVARMKQTPINDLFADNGRIREDGRMVHDMYLVQVKKPEESKEPWDYYKVLATIPGDKAFQPLSESKCRLVKRGS